MTFAPSSCERGRPVPEGGSTPYLKVAFVWSAFALSGRAIARVNEP